MIYKRQIRFFPADTGHGSYGMHCANDSERHTVRAIGEAEIEEKNRKSFELRLTDFSIYMPAASFIALS